MANETKNTRVSAKQKISALKEQTITFGDIFNDEELNALIKKSTSLGIEEKDLIKLGVKGIVNGAIKLVPKTTYDIE